MKITHKYDNQIDIELDNGNTVRITEVESGTIQLENVTDNPQRDALGFSIEPIGIGVISITPEG